MNLKIVDEEYKIYSLYCLNDYIINFKFNSVTKKIIKLTIYSDFF